MKGWCTVTEQQLEALVISIHTIDSEATETLISDVLRRLDSIGYTDYDAFVVSFGISKTLEKVKAECGDIPDGIYKRLVDACCGEVLYSLYGAGKLDISTLDLSGTVSQIKEGDTMVAYDNETSDTQKFTTLINNMRIKAGDLACYRTIKWS